MKLAYFWCHLLKLGQGTDSPADAAASLGPPGSGNCNILDIILSSAWNKWNMQEMVGASKHNSLIKENSYYLLSCHQCIAIIIKYFFQCYIDHISFKIDSSNFSNISSLHRNYLRGNLQKKRVYLKTLSKLRLTTHPPTLFLTNYFLTIFD